MWGSVAFRDVGGRWRVREVVAVGIFPVEVRGKVGLVRWRGREVVCRLGVGVGFVGGGLCVEVGALEEFVDGAWVPASATWGGYAVGGELVGDLLECLAGGA